MNHLKLKLKLFIWVFTTWQIIHLPKWIVSGNHLTTKMYVRLNIIYILIILFYSLFSVIPNKKFIFVLCLKKQILIYFKWNDLLFTVNMIFLLADINKILWMIFKNFLFSVKKFHCNVLLRTIAPWNNRKNETYLWFRIERTMMLFTAGKWTFCYMSMMK